jgi:hypothetical protein
VKEHAGGVDQCGVGRFAGSSQRVEDFACEGLVGIAVRGVGCLAVAYSSAETFDGGATRVDDRRVAVPIRGVAEGRMVEKAMNRRDVPVSVVHGGYSIAAASRRHRWS